MWVLNSVLSRHLVNDEELLEDAREYDDQCLVAEGKTLRLTMVGNVVFHGMACGKASVLRLTEVYYAPLITRSIVLYGNHEFKGYGLKYNDDRRARISHNTGCVVFDMGMRKNVLVIEMPEE